MPLPRTWAIAGLCVALCGCGGAGGGAAGAVTLASGRIGPEGGVVTVTGGDLNGLRLEVPAGAVAAPAEFTVSQVTTAGLSPLPPGFVAFNPTVRIQAGAPVSGAVRLVFPIHGVAAGANEAMGAYAYDDASAAWSLVIPQAVSAQQLTVDSAHLGTWRWGVTVLGDLPADHVAKAIAAWLGQTLYQAFQAALQSQAQKYVTAPVADTTVWTNCQKLVAIGTTLVEAGDGAMHDLRDTLKTQCGGCDVSFEEFEAEFGKYIELKVKKLMVDGFVEAMNQMADMKSELVGLLMQFTTGAAFAALQGQLACNFECLFEDPPAALIFDLATIAVTTVGAILVVYAESYDHCPTTTTVPALLASRPPR